MTKFYDNIPDKLKAAYLPAITLQIVRNLENTVGEVMDLMANTKKSRRDGAEYKKGKSANHDNVDNQVDEKELNLKKTHAPIERKHNSTLHYVTQAMLNSILSFLNENGLKKLLETGNSNIKTVIINHLEPYDLSVSFDLESDLKKKGIH